MVTVRFFTRTGCHLCERAEAVLRSERNRIPFEIVLHDIDTDAEWRELYNDLVPVTMLPDGTEMHYRIDVDRLRQALDDISR